MATSQVVQTSNLPAAFETYYKTGLTAKDSPTGAAIPGLIPQAFKTYGQGTVEDFQKVYADPLKAGIGAAGVDPVTGKALGTGLYGAGRIANLTPNQQTFGTEISGMVTPGQFASGTDAVGSGITSLEGLPSMLTPGQIQEYMSPYTQNVVDVQKQEALRDAQQAQLAQNLGAARQGTYGGARQLLATTERERNLADQMGKIQASGLQSAYEAAQKGLESERAARIQQAQTYGTLGQQYGQLGVAQQAADLDRLKTLGAYGDLERAIEQQRLDARYADLMRGIQYPESQLEKLSGFLRGVPTTDTVQTTTTPPPSLYSQMAGMGLAGLSMMNMLGGKS